jgi:hypothetical protein
MRKLPESYVPSTDRHLTISERPVIMPLMSVDEMLVCEYLRFFARVFIRYQVQICETVEDMQKLYDYQTRRKARIVLWCVRSPSTLR